MVFLRLGFVRDGRGQGDSQYCVKGTYGVCSFAGLLDWTAKNQVLLSIRRVNVVLQRVPSARKQRLGVFTF